MRRSSVIFPSDISDVRWLPPVGGEQQISISGGNVELSMEQQTGTITLTNREKGDEEEETTSSEEETTSTENEKTPPNNKKNKKS